MKLPKEIWNIIKFRFHDGIEFMIFAELFVAFLAAFCSLLMKVANESLVQTEFPFWTFFLYFLIGLQLIPIMTVVGAVRQELRFVRKFNR
jgi:hypothetical protein